MAANLITFSGPRGAGKDTLLGKVEEEYKSHIYRIKPCTTRNPRIGEEHGNQQYFISLEQFLEYESQNKFAFTNPPNSTGYRSGTLKTEIKEGLSMIDITAVGAEDLRNQIFAQNGSVLSFFIYASYGELFHRIKKRQRELEDGEIKNMLTKDLTNRDPNYHPDWFIKIHNADNKLDSTLNEIYYWVEGFISLLKNKRSAAS